MECWESGETGGDGERVACRVTASVTALPGARTAGGHAAPAPPGETADTTLLDLLPHPAFAIAVDGDDAFRFIYTNDAYRALRGDETLNGEIPDGRGFEAAPGDLRSVVPANALVAHVRAFARAARADDDLVRDRMGDLDPGRDASRST